MRVIITVITVAAFFNATAMCLQYPLRMKLSKRTTLDTTLKAEENIQSATQPGKTDSTRLIPVHDTSNSTNQTIQLDQAIIQAIDQMTSQADEIDQMILTQAPQEDEMTTQAALEEQVTTLTVSEDEITTQTFLKREITTQIGLENLMTTQAITENQMKTQEVSKDETLTQAVSKNDMTTQTIRINSMDQIDQKSINTKVSQFVTLPSNRLKKRTLKITVSQNITKDCLDCMCILISQCRASPRCSDGLCGKFQIGLNYWMDAGNKTVNHEQLSSNEKFISFNLAFERCAYNDTCTRETVESFMWKYGQDCNEDGFINCYDYAQIHHYSRSHPGARPGDIKCKKDNFSHGVEEAMRKCMRIAEVKKWSD